MAEGAGTVLEGLEQELKGPESSVAQKGEGRSGTDEQNLEECGEGENRSVYNRQKGNL